MKSSNLLKLIALLFFTNLKPETELLQPSTYNIKIDWLNEVTDSASMAHGQVNLTHKNNTIGYIYYQKNLKDSSCFISYFKIEAEWRNKKIGSVFLKHVCKKFVEQKIKQISLTASPFEYKGTPKYRNLEYSQMLSKLILFYKSCGFESIKDNPNYAMTYTVK